MQLNKRRKACQKGVSSDTGPREGGKSSALDVRDKGRGGEREKVEECVCACERIILITGCHTTRRPEKDSERDGKTRWSELEKDSRRE